MLRTIVVFSLAVCLSSSMLLPSITNLLDTDFQVTAMMDLPEEENQKQAEKELDEKDVLVSDSINSEISGLNFLEGRNLFYQEVGSTYHLRIHLPPPERIS